MSASTAASQSLAGALSRHLRTQGVVVLASGTSRMREGVRVQRSVGGPAPTASVHVDFDGTSHARRVADAIVEILDRGPWVVTRNSELPTILYVTRKD